MDLLDLHREAIKLLPAVREAMRWLRIEVVERPLPKIEVGEPHSRAYYSGFEHRVHMPIDHGLATLAHELCHSQQVKRKSRAVYYLPDGSVDDDLWLAEPREIEAMAVEVVAFAAMRPDWEAVKTAVDATGVTDITDRASLVCWLNNGDLTAPKRGRSYGSFVHLGRRARLTINAAMRSITKGE
jgi:hypothetical protein